MTGIEQVGWLIKSALFVANVVRKLGGRKIVIKGKQYVALQSLSPLHVETIHHIRTLGLDMMEEDESRTQRCIRQATFACTAMKETYSNLLDLDRHQLQCSIKLFTPDKTIFTFARSTPYDDRPLDDQGPHSQITDGTPWCALLGQSDGVTSWRRQVCFACNDLLSAHARGLFVCKRNNWMSLYKSAIVFPICYRADGNPREAAVIGFLSFDSPLKDAFYGVPDIFSYREHQQRPEYHERLHQVATFHLGAIMADTLSMALRPYTQQWPSSQPLRMTP